MSAIPDLDLESVEAFLHQNDCPIRKKPKPISYNSSKFGILPSKHSENNPKQYSLHKSSSRKRHKKHRHKRSRSRSPKHFKPAEKESPQGKTFENKNSLEKAQIKTETGSSKSIIKEFEVKMEQKIKEAEEAKRDDLTVLVLQLPIKASEIDVYKFFSFNSCGKIRDIRIIKDPKNGKSKGVAYVEFYSEESKFKALSQSGKYILDNAIKIQPSHAEKNRAHAVARQNKIVRPYFGSETVQNEKAPLSELPREPSRVYIEGLGDSLSDIQEADLKLLFSPFGEIEFLDLRRVQKTLQCKGFAMIQYKNANDARAALEMMNGFEINNHKITVRETPSVSVINIPHNSSFTPNTNNNAQISKIWNTNPMIDRDLDIEDASSFLHSAQSRYMLMQKLTREGTTTENNLTLSFEEKSNNSDFGVFENTIIQTAQGPKKILPEANVFVKNIDQILSIGMLENAFSLYGNILSCKIATDQVGNSLGYGYVQFETKEAADLAIAQGNNTKLKNNVIQVQPFISKINRLDAKNNLYIKNLPNNMKDEELNHRLLEVFSVFGPITSSTVKFDSNIGRPYAFICFENHMNAEMAFRNMQGSDPFNIGSGLYIGWAEKKPERVKRLTELYSKNMIESLMGFGYKL